MSERVQVPWLCGYPVEIPGQGVIEPGGLAWIGAGEAAASEHWGEPVKLEDLPKTELQDLAVTAGVDPAGKTKTELAGEVAKAKVP